jgi:desulfoferrodoxin-like iron-binding protein
MGDEFPLMTTGLKAVLVPHLNSRSDSGILEVRRVLNPDAQEGDMKKSLISISVICAAAGLMLIASGWAQKPTAPLKDQDYTQPEPYTAKNFGPWNEAVAATHVPQVTFEKMGMGVKVTVQIDNHPMDPQKPHWIMWIRLEDMMGKKLGEKTFKATDPRPAVAVFELPSIPSKIKAFERCNIHGIWLNEIAVELK